MAANKVFLLWLCTSAVWFEGQGQIRIQCTPDHNGYVLENANFNCRCSTSQTAPTLRLRWMKGRDSTFSNTLVTSNFNATFLDMTTQTLSRSEDGITQFRCELSRTSSTLDFQTFTAHVGFAPEQMQFKVNSNAGDVYIFEGESVAFHCQANGRPTPNIILENKDNNAQLTRSLSSAFYNIVVTRCEDAANYMCTANNGLGRNMAMTFKLYVKCGPRRPEGSNGQIPDINFSNMPAKQSFTVIAYPTPDRFTFSFLGQSESTKRNNSEVRDVVLTIRCQESRFLYAVECTILAENITTLDATGAYKVRVNNTYGSEEFIFHVYALIIYPTGLDSTVEAIDGKRDKLVKCMGLRSNDVVEWRVEDRTDNYGAGRCFSELNKPCEISILYPAFNATRTSAVESVMIIDTTQLNHYELFKSGRITCQTDRLWTRNTLDLVYPTEGSCTAMFRRNTYPWTVFIQCTITKAFSAQNRYRCHLYQTQHTLQDVTIGKSVTMAIQVIRTGEMYVSGSCEFSESIPTSEWPYLYTVTVIPGMTNISAPFTGVNNLIKPSQPSVFCNFSLNGLENATFTCTCIAQSVGSPGGRLRWSRGSQNIINTLINAGILDVTRLDMVQTLQSSEYDVTQFRCDIEWAEIVQGNIYNAIVKYPPSVPQIKLNSKPDNLTVSENDSVIITCKANGRPTPTMKLLSREDSSQLNSVISPLIYNLSSAQCHHSATYLCTGSNGVGTDTSIFARLYVNCSPRFEAATDVSGKVTTLNYVGYAIRHVLKVTAYPNLNLLFKFAFLGSTLNGDRNETEVRDIKIDIICLPSQFVYLSTCTLTIDNVTPNVTGFYGVTFANVHGQNEFIFQLTYSDVADDESVIIAAVLGSILSIIVIGVIINIFLVRRCSGRCEIYASLTKRKEEPLSYTGLDLKVNNHNSLGKGNSYENTAHLDTLTTGGSNPAYNNEPVTPKDVNVYEELQKREAVGPPYETLMKPAKT